MVSLLATGDVLKCRKDFLCGQHRCSIGLLFFIDIFKDEQYQKLNQLHELEEKSDVLAKELSDNHYKRMTANECNGALSDDFATLISELERVADHLVNVGYSIVNPVGDDEFEAKNA